MLNPQDLQNAIVGKLQAIAELVSFIGDIGEIQAYDDESQVSGNPEEAEFSMMSRGVLVIWTGAELPRLGEMRGWKHTFKLALKAESIQSYFTLAKLIMDGVPAGECDNFLNVTIHPECDGIQDAEVLPERSSDHVGRLAIQFAIHER